MNRTFRTSVSCLAAAGLISALLGTPAQAQWDPLRQAREAAKRAKNSVRKEAGNAADGVKRAHQLNYRVEIANRGQSPVFYQFDGTGQDRVAGGYVSTHVGTSFSNPSIAFNNGQGQTIKYTLPSGRYYFWWNGNVLQLSRQ